MPNLILTALMKKELPMKYNYSAYVGFQMPAHILWYTTATGILLQGASTVTDCLHISETIWLNFIKFFCACLLWPSLQVCNPAYLVPVPSQDKLGGLRLGMIKVGASMVRMGWRPAGLSVHLPLLCSPRLIKSRMMTDSHNTFQVWVGECLFWYRHTRVVPDKGT